jgi:hypothetical protein
MDKIQTQLNLLDENVDIVFQKNENLKKFAIEVEKNMKLNCSRVYRFIIQIDNRLERIEQKLNITEEIPESSASYDEEEEKQEIK